MSEASLRSFDRALQLQVLTRVLLEAAGPETAAQMVLDGEEPFVEYVRAGYPDEKLSFEDGRVMYRLLLKWMFPTGPRVN